MPRLRGYPLAVRVPGSQRMVLGVSSEAWKAGVCRGMPIEAAKRLCPDLVSLDPVPSVYDRIDKILFEKACGFSPLVERAGPGHLFIDLSGTQRLLGKPIDAAGRIRTIIRDACGIDPVLGISTNRLVSKIATQRSPLTKRKKSYAKPCRKKCRENVA